MSFVSPRWPGRRRSGPAATALGVAAAALIAAMSPGAADAGTLEVNWVQPEQFIDAGRGSVDRDRNLEQLALEFSRLGRVLPAGQTLKIEVTELDMAGELEPLFWPHVRILRQRADWPRMSLRYTLLADGRTLKAGEAQLADMAYALGRHAGSAESPEARMLARWLRDEFAGGR